MFPHEHFIVALILVVMYIFARERKLPSRSLIAITFVGSQYPDLIDKPLALQLGVIPTGRVFMHSLSFAIPVSIAVLAYAWKTDRFQAGIVFVIAYASHLVTDNYAALVAGEIPNDLVWPFRPPIPRPDIPHWSSPSLIEVHLFTAFSIVVLSITAYYLVLDIRKHLFTSDEQADSN